MDGDQDRSWYGKQDLTHVRRHDERLVAHWCLCHECQVGENPAHGREGVPIIMGGVVKALFGTWSNSRILWVVQVLGDQNE